MKKNIEILMRFVKFLSQKKLVYFGAFTAQAKLLTEVLPLVCSYYVDKDPLKWNKIFLGKRVFSPIELSKEESINIAILCTDISYGNTSNMMKQMGFTEGVHYWNALAIFHDILIPYINHVVDPQLAGIIINNKRFRAIHQEKRCFVLCNGPSVNSQNLLPLKNEIVFSVSGGYHHKDFRFIAPRYHCLPQLTYTQVFSKDVAIAYFKEMHENLGCAELFLSSSEYSLVQENNLFPGRKINYLFFGRNFIDGEEDIIDISAAVPSVWTVPIMCIMIAMYMGFTSIYLLGVQHDELRLGEYKYFYEPTLLKGRDIAVDADGKTRNTMFNLLSGYLEIWKQYRALKHIALKHGVQIYNATPESMLDEFPHVELESII